MCFLGNQNSITLNFFTSLVLYIHCGGGVILQPKHHHWNIVHLYMRHRNITHRQWCGGEIKAGTDAWERESRFEEKNTGAPMEISYLLLVFLAKEMTKTTGKFSGNWNLQVNFPTLRFFAGREQASGMVVRVSLTHRAIWIGSRWQYFRSVTTSTEKSCLFVRMAAPSSVT